MRPLELERVLQESAKLECIRQLGLPADLFAHDSAKTLASYRQRIAVEDLRGLTPPIYSNVNPYGLIRLNMTERLVIERAEVV